MNPGDKVNVSFHKAKAEPGSSFVDKAKSAGMIPGGQAPAAPALMPQMSAVSHPAVPDHRAMLLAHLRQRMLMGR
jgi:hypothetical protein